MQSEELIVYKIVAARAIDLEDARQLALRHWTTIDPERVRRILADFDAILEDGRSRVELWRATERSARPSWECACALGRGGSLIWWFHADQAPRVV